MSRHVYVIAGPNGAGKTTFARTFLPQFASCEEFVNADLVATGLSPFLPRNAALQAGRLVLQRIHALAKAGKTFGFETTLSGKGYLSLFRALHRKGYQIHLFFLWLPNPTLAVDRVRDRVKQGGHNVPEDDIRRRYMRGLKNMFGSYKPLLNAWMFIDNSAKLPVLIAYGTDKKSIVVHTDLYYQAERQVSL